MGLRSAFQNAAQAAVKAFGDIPVSANYLSHVTTTYDTSAGTDTTTYSTVAGIKVIFTSFSVEQIDGQAVKPEDRLALIAARDISGVTPGVNDQIKVDTSIVWEAMSHMVDPAGALHKIQVRRP